MYHPRPSAPDRFEKASGSDERRRRRDDRPGVRGGRGAARSSQRRSPGLRPDRRARHRGAGPRLRSGRRRRAGRRHRVRRRRRQGRDPRGRARLRRQGQNRLRRLHRSLRRDRPARWPAPAPAAGRGRAGGRRPRRGPGGSRGAARALRSGRASALHGARGRARDREPDDSGPRRRGVSAARLRRRRGGSADRDPARPGRDRQPGGRAGERTNPRGRLRPVRHTGARTLRLRQLRARQDRVPDVQDGRRRAGAPVAAGRTLVARRLGRLHETSGWTGPSPPGGCRGGPRAGGGRPRDRGLRDDGRSVVPAGGQDCQGVQAQDALHRSRRRVPSERRGRRLEARPRPAGRLPAARPPGVRRRVDRRDSRAAAADRPLALQSEVDARRGPDLLADHVRPRRSRGFRPARARGSGARALEGRRARSRDDDPGQTARSRREPRLARRRQDRQRRRRDGGALRREGEGRRTVDRRQALRRAGAAAAAGRRQRHSRRAHFGAGRAAVAGARRGLRAGTEGGRGPGRHDLDAGRRRDSGKRRPARRGRQDRRCRERSFSPGRRDRDQRLRQARDARHHRRALAHGRRRPDQRGREQRDGGGPDSGRPEPLCGIDLPGARGRDDDRQRAPRLGQRDRRAEPDRQVPPGRRTRHDDLRGRAGGHQVRARREPEAVERSDHAWPAPALSRRRAWVSPT